MLFLFYLFIFTLFTIVSFVIHPVALSPLPNLNSWYCGFDDITKGFSLFLVGTCPRDPSIFMIKK